VLACATTFAIGCYEPALGPCTVRCRSTLDCPSGMACGNDTFCHVDTNEAACDVGCRGAPETCGTRLDGGVDAAADAAIVAGDGPTGQDAAVGTPEWYGCFAVADGATTCTELCRSEGRTCGTCNGEVWYAYSLAGPCAASQPTRFGGTSCSDHATIGTGDTIYVQCCCQ
jgi:hypothetical protein